MSNFLSFSSVMTYIGYIAIAIFVLLLMVTIHEFGHYIAGKILKFKINEFSIGFGPKLFQKTKKNGELFTLRLFPLGGYCAFEGENEDGSDNPAAFKNQKPWKRLIVLFSGAFFNFLSAIIFSFILLLSNGYDFVQVKSVANDSINYEVLYENDVIYGVGGKDIDFVVDDSFNVLITEYVQDNYIKNSNVQTESHYNYVEDGKTFYMVKENFELNIKRDGEKIDIKNAVVNVVYNEKGEYVGWSLLNSEAKDEDFVIGTYRYSFGEALLQAIPFTCKWAVKVLIVFGQLITGQLNLTSLGGPVTTINMIATYTQTNFSYLVMLLPIIAVNLAVFNLLPIPALDGCQMIFVLIEWIRKKPIKSEVINVINNIGLIALLGLVIVVDILQFVL